MVMLEGRPEIPVHDATPLTKKIRFRGITFEVAREHVPVFEAARDLLTKKLEGEGREVLRRWIETWEENRD